MCNKALIECGLLCLCLYFILFFMTSIYQNKHPVELKTYDNYTKYQMIKKRQNILTRYEDYNLTILDQISTNKLPYLPCQNITDIQHFPIVRATDDFIIPPLSTFILNNIPSGIDNCRAIIFSISYMRSYRDSDPENIILYVMRDSTINDDNGYPGEIIFKKTFKQPNNGWNIITTNPGSLILRINVGDPDDNGNEFDISSSSLYSGSRLWVSFYVTLKKHFTYTGFSENMVYWIIYKKEKDLKLNELDSPYKYYNSTSQYYFRDFNNLFDKNLIQWSSATETEKKMGISSNTLNMAWKVDLLCKKTIVFIEINKTSEPTQSPTLQPTKEWIDNNKTDIPEKHDSSSVLSLILFFFISLIIILCITCLFFLQRICYKPTKIKNIDEYIERHLKENGENVLYTPYKPKEENDTEIDDTVTEGFFVSSSDIQVEIVLDNK